MHKLLISSLAAGLVGSSFAITISFDEAGPGPTFFSNANLLTSAYSGLGVIFSGPNFLDGGAIVNQSGNFGVNALSGTNFLGFNRNAGVTLASGGRPLDPETITFTTFVNSVSIWASGGGNLAVFSMVAKDSLGGVLGLDIETSQAGQWTQLSFASTSAIQSVTLTEVTGDSAFVYDDLSAVPEPASLAILGLGAAALIKRRRNRS